MLQCSVSMLAYNKFSLATLVTLLSPHPVAGLIPYQHFFPRRGQALVELIKGNCSSSYDAFRQGIPASVNNSLLGYWSQDDPAWAVNNCLLSEALESVKADFSSAQLILGLMPTILGSLGPSSQEISLLLVLGNRQLLAFFLALGSPFTRGDHSLDFAREIESLPSARLPWQASAPFLYFQYFIVFAAIANIAELSYELARNAPSTIIQHAPNYLPGLMAVVGFTMHLLVAFAFRLCVETENSSTAWTLEWFKKWTSQQFGATTIKEDHPRHFELNTANFPYTITSWVAKIAIFTHIGYHIVAFSTVLFVSSRDAVVLLFRYFASVCVCRMVAANELAVLGTIVEWKKAETQNSQISVHKSPGEQGHR